MTIQIEACARLQYQLQIFCLSKDIVSSRQQRASFRNGRSSVESVFLIRYRNITTNFDVADTIFRRYVFHLHGIQVVLNFRDLCAEIRRSVPAGSSRRQHQRLSILNIRLLQAVSEPQAVVAVIPRRFAVVIVNARAVAVMSNRNGRRIITFTIILTNLGKRIFNRRLSVGIQNLSVLNELDAD